MIDQPLLSVQHLSKNYGAVEALKDVSFELRRGEVVGLVGDNGAGKSTLVNCVAGVLTPSGGEIHLEGTQHEFGSPADALAAGVETVYQDLALVEMFDMTDNLFLGRELVRGGMLRPFGFLRKREMATAARQAVAQLPARFPDLDAPIDTMSGGQRQVVAISKAAFWVDACCSSMNRPRRWASGSRPASSRWSPTRRPAATWRSSSSRTTLSTSSRSALASSSCAVAHSWPT